MDGPLFVTRIVGTGDRAARASPLAAPLDGYLGGLRPRTPVSTEEYG